MKYMLFSATFPKPARDLAKDHLAEDHIRIRVGRAGSSHANIRQVVHSCQESDKKRLLYDSMITMPPVRTIIFVNNKRTADELDDFLFNLGVPCTSMHSDRTQREREAAMRGFRGGDSPVLVTTGVTARGIDVRNVMHVINYDLPSVDFGGIEEYTHRIGKAHCPCDSPDFFLTRNCRPNWSHRPSRPGHLVLHREGRADRVGPDANPAGDGTGNPRIPTAIRSRW